MEQDTSKKPPDEQHKVGRASSGDNQLHVESKSVTPVWDIHRNRQSIIKKTIGKNIVDLKKIYLKGTRKSS
jgi:hypothetical protein